MIATHNPKSLNPRLKQGPVSARLAGVPDYLLCSQHVVGPELFAAPANAADIREARQMAATAVFATSIPDLQDGRAKQLLLPWSGSYVAVTPLPSGKVMQQVHERARMMQEHPRLWAHMRTIQPVAAAANNHGDPVAEKGGRALLIEQRIWPLTGPVAGTLEAIFDCHGVLYSADVTGLQISSNYVQAGLPALTGIGGAVHVIERATGFTLPFALALEPFEQWQEGKMGGRGKAGVAVKDMIADEITANVRLHLLLQCSTAQQQAVIDALQSLTRIAGGTVWNAQAHSVTPETAQPPLRWIMPVQVTADPADGDLLDTFLDMRRQRPKQSGIVQSGFALLHEPRQQAMSRADGGLHAWAEPIFTAALLDMPLTQDGFWQRHQAKWGVWWE